MSRFYAQKGHAATEADFLALGTGFLRLGYPAYIGKEKVGNISRRYIEIYEEVPFGHEKGRSGGNDTESGKEN